MMNVYRPASIRSVAKGGSSFHSALQYFRWTTERKLREVYLATKKAYTCVKLEMNGAVHEVQYCSEM